MSKQKILVFTNYASIEVVAREDVNRKGINLIADASVVGFNAAMDCFTQDYFDKEIILVYDGIAYDDNDFTELTGKLKGEALLILRHQFPSEEILSKFDNSYVKSGRHETNGPNYNVFFKIILDQQGGKYERIKNAIFPDSESLALTEKKLRLLHDCLHSKSAATVNTSWLSEKQAAIVAFLAAQTDNVSGTYLEKLEELQKSLLGS
jgi:hypothetical protein